MIEAENMGKSCCTCVYGHLDQEDNSGWYCEYNRTHIRPGKDECEYYKTLLEASKGAIEKAGSYSGYSSGGIDSLIGRLFNKITKLVLIIIIVSALLTVGYNNYFSEPVPLTNRNMSDVTGNDYQILKYKGKQDWDKAQRWCKKQGGHLATISSDDENTFLYVILVGIEADHAYIGYSANSKSEWEWVQKEKKEGKVIKQEITYSKWKDKQPDIVTGKYAKIQTREESFEELGEKFDELSPDYFNSWETGDFTDEKIFICEWDN